VSFDRRVAFGCWVLAAIALVATTAISDPPPVPIENDEAAFEDLVAYLDASVTGDWLVEFEAVRTDAEGQRVAGLVTEARHEPYHVVLSDEQATIDDGQDAFSCLVVETGLECLRRTERETISTADVVRAAVDDADAYVVTRLRGQDIANEDASCFRLFAASGYLPGLGAETRYCFSDDGIPLWTQTIDLQRTDERRARLVVRNPSTARVEGMVRGLEAAVPEVEG
jgi:hypothetical protein